MLMLTAYNSSSPSQLWSSFFRWKSDSQCVKSVLQLKQGLAQNSLISRTQWVYACVRTLEMVLIIIPFSHSVLSLPFDSDFIMQQSRRWPGTCWSHRSTWWVWARLQNPLPMAPPSRKVWNINIYFYENIHSIFKGVIQAVWPNREHQDDITWERKEARWCAGGGGRGGRICGGKGAEPTSGERESRVPSQVERLLRVSLRSCHPIPFHPRVRATDASTMVFVLQRRQHVGARRQPGLSGSDRRIPAVTEIGAGRKTEGERRGGRRRK